MSIKTILSFLWRYTLIFILFAIFFMLGAGAAAGKMPTGASEPGLVSGEVGLLIMITAETLVISALILTSRWGGWKLALLLSLAYYSAVTFLMQIETWCGKPALAAGQYVNESPDRNRIFHLCLRDDCHLVAAPGTQIAQRFIWAGIKFDLINLHNNLSWERAT